MTKTIITIPHDGYMLTIAEVIEAIELATNVKITQITESDGKLSFVLHDKEPETADTEPYDYSTECKMCGKEWSLNDEGYCSQCWVIWNS